jgi:CheY-like chemotaxis protein
VSQRYDVGLADLEMPEPDGFSLLAELQAQRADPAASIPTIAITAHASERVSERALAAGFRRCLAERVEPRLLLEEIQAVLQTRMGAA